MAKNKRLPSLASILEAIRLFHFERGYCPSIRQLEAEFEISRMSIWRRVKILEKQGHLETIDRKGIVLR